MTYPQIPWIDLQSLRHMLADAHEFTDNAWALLRFFLRDNKLHRRGVHPITERRDNSQVSYREQGVELVLFQGLVAMTTIRIDKMTRGCPHTNDGQG